MGDLGFIEALIDRWWKPVAIIMVLLIVLHPQIIIHPAPMATPTSIATPMPTLKPSLPTPSPRPTPTPLPLSLDDYRGGVVNSSGSYFPGWSPGTFGKWGTFPAIIMAYTNRAGYVYRSDDPILISGTGSNQYFRVIPMTGYPATPTPAPTIIPLYKDW